MNFAVFPIMLVDHFDASNAFVGTLAIVQSATQIVAYPVIGRLIDRGSTLRQTLIATLITVLVPIGYLIAPGTWALLPVAVIIGIGVSSGELTGIHEHRAYGAAFTHRGVRRGERVPAGCARYRGAVHGRGAARAWCSRRSSSCSARSS